MSDKKTNEIIEEQRRARNEFLKLKKMQSGEISAEPKPSEVAFVPKTFKEKLSNFWFIYKGAVIGITLTVVALAVLVAQCATRVESDLEILYFTYTPTLDTQTEKMADYFEKYVADLNGDQEVNVTVLNCSLSNDGANVQYNNTILTKVQTILVGNDKALLIITDDESIKYFDNIKTENGLFKSEGVALGEDFYSSVKVEGIEELPKNLKISLRKIEGTVLEKEKNINKYYDASEKLLENIKNVN